jgi:1-acyl-sn-glycerol-3-phosphate acyltransferase
MYALVQLRTEANYRARIMAANNILNALFMVTSALLVGWLLHAGATIPQIFLIAGLANLVVAAYLFLLVPEYVLRFLAFLASTFIYRFNISGDRHIPTHGPAILICNHVSYVDAILLMAASPRPIVFIMDHEVFQTPGLGAIFRFAKAIPIASRNDDSALYTLAFERAAGTLKNGGLLAIFPEGKLTPNGEMQEFKGGMMKIIEQARRDGLNPPIIPMAILNLWGSLFSRARLASTLKWPSARAKRHGMFRKVDLNIGEPLPASEATVPMVRQRIEALLTMVD